LLLYEVLKKLKKEERLQCKEHNSNKNNGNELEHCDLDKNTRKRKEINEKLKAEGKFLITKQKQDRAQVMINI